jgi:serine/threonine protein kinase/WD40 repeat protein
MSTPTSESDLFNNLAHEFAERYRRGERPPLSEYTERYPELADEIRDLFPTLVMMERLGSGVVASASESSPSSRAAMSIPERLGEFRIVREIGRGGMGIVYEAVQESLGRHVALKVLPFGHQIGPVQLKRFEREAKAAAVLHHSNIVPIFGVGEHDGVHYYAMQYIQGQSLDAVLREVIRLRRHADTSKILPSHESENLAARLASDLTTARRSHPQVGLDHNGPSAAMRTGNALPETSHLDAARRGALDDPSSASALIPIGPAVRYYRSVAQAGAQAADALDYAHLHGVLHRDIKPANLLLDLQGTIWVTDFGLAKAAGYDELTSPGDVVGTLRYMAPERFRDLVDARCDIYSLGMTLYELLTLKPAFAASERATLVNLILHQEPVRPRKHDSQIPRDLETIVLKAIAKNPSDRFATAGEMARELGRYVAGRPIHSRRASLPERVWRAARRNPAIAVLSLLAVTLTTVLAIGSTAAAWKFREQRDAVSIEQQNTTAALGGSLLLQARALRYSRQPGRRGDALKTLADAARIAHVTVAPPGQLDQLRHEVIATLGEVDERPLRVWSGLKNLSDDLSFSFESDRYVVLEGDGSFHLRRLSDRSDVLVVRPKSPSVRSRPVLIEGGRFVIVWSGSSQTELWDLERGDMAVAWPDDVRCATARADGKQVAALRCNGELRVYDLPAMTEAARFRLDLDVPTRYAEDRMSLSSDGRYLAFMRPEIQKAWVYNVPTGRIVLDLKTPNARVHVMLTLSRNGSLLAVIHDRAISVYDVVAGERLSLLQGHQSEGITARFQRVSDLLASTGWDGSTRVWDPIRGRLLVTLRGAFRSWMQREPNLVIRAGNEIVLHRYAAAEERKTIDCRMLSDQAATALFGPARLAYSPDGRLIAMALRPEGVRIVRASDGVGLAYLPIGNCDEVLFLRDGSLLTSNNRGLCRWPVREVEHGRLQMGPPEPLAPIDRILGVIPAGLAANASGRLAGVIAPGHLGILLLDPERPWQRSWLAPQQRAIDVAISPDGRWVAATTLASEDRAQVKIWDASAGQLRAELPLGMSLLTFSPDGQWLGIGAEARWQFFKTGSWKPGAEIDKSASAGFTRIAFHPGSQIAAIVDSNHSLARLADVRTGRVLASLEAPNDASIYCMVFSPDGRYLAVSHTDQRVDVWDLSSIRRRLEELHLETGIPDIFGTVGSDVDVPTIDKIKVRGADRTGLRLLAIRQILREAGFAVRSLLSPGLADAEQLRIRGVRWARLGHWQLAVGDFRSSLEREPNMAFTANELAWCFASMPGRGHADEAVRWAQKAVELAPGNTNYRNTLGAALYRSSRFAEAVVELERDIAANSEVMALDWVFLAMCKERLGLAAQARLALQQATRWAREAPPRFSDQIETLDALLREAHSVLAGSLPDLPSDVFDH